jgi:TM2 domain-containing membrane protein YozV
MALALSVSHGAAMGPFRTDSVPSVSDPGLQPVELFQPMTLQEDHRGVAIALAVLLGPFGAHRLYLGTTTKVAIAYGLTFGGFGVVAIIDLVHLIASKDLDRFRDCDRILMWAGSEAPVSSP